jgi:hypothetical protein
MDNIDRTLMRPSAAEWNAPRSRRQEEAQTLVSILNDYLAGRPMPEPKWRRAMYAASAVFHQETDW